jgi:hypothetical protein
VSIDQVILLPYDNPTEPIPGVWSTGPSPIGINRGLSNALNEIRATQPYLIVEEGQPTPPLTVSTSESLTIDTPARVVAAIESGAADSLVITASAVASARLIAKVQQGLGVKQIPVIITPPATTPLFARTLLRDGPISRTLISVGPNTSDPAALAPGPSGANAASFFAALRFAANDPSCLNIFGDAPLAASSHTADMASQDAAIALVRAAEQAGSTSPTAMMAIMSSLQVTPQDGLSGPPLDFTTPFAQTDTTIQVLYASTQNPAVRPPSTSSHPTLVWFPID